MNKINQAIRKGYFEMQGKIIFPEDKCNEHKQLAATVSANFASIGFPMTTEQTIRLSKSDADEIVMFYKENIELFKEVLGSNYEMKPFYPDFPSGCMKRNDVEYFIDQIIYGFSGLEIEPSIYMQEKKRFPFMGTPMHRVVLDGTLEDVFRTLKLAVSSPIAYSKEQREFMYECAKEFPETTLDIILDNADTKNRENAVTCAVLLETLTESRLYTKRFMKQPVDLLRYAAFKSVQKETPERDPYTAIALRDKADTMPRFSLGRKERTFIMDMLAEMADDDGARLSNKMHGHDTEWNRLFKKLHISDKAWSDKKYNAVKEAIVIIQSGKKIDRPARRIEEAVKANDVELAVKETRKMPGEFMRRFDKLYRMAIEQNKADFVLDAMKDISKKAGIATVTGTIGNIECRCVDEETRYFKAKTGKVYQTSDKNRKAFTPEEIEAAVKVAMDGMSERFKGKELMGKVFMSKTLNNVKIPVDIRNSSVTMTSGSKMPIPKDWDLMRFFVGWTNMPNENRVDIDLSVTFCDQKMNRVAFCGWNGKKSDKGFVYSGDVQSGGSCNGGGRAEFVDIDINVMRNQGVRYVIPDVNSYTGQYFSCQPHTYFGVMKRTKTDMGKAYEPSTIMNRFILDSETTMVVPYIIDIQNMEVLWLNSVTDHQTALHSFDDIQSQIARESTSKTMTLDRLIEANVIANGTFVDNPNAADVIFVTDITEMEDIMENTGLTDSSKFILSSNMEYITGYLMSEARGHIV